MHALLPLIVALMGTPTVASLDPPVGTAPDIRAMSELRLPIRLPVPLLQARLARELRRAEKDILDDFQVVCSKFTDGRVVLTGLRLEPASEPNRVRVRASVDLDFARRQLGVKWRGLKSRKKWYDRGRKTVARVELRGTIEVDPTLDRDLADTAITFRLSDLTAKVTSRLRPVRGAAFTFGLRDRSEVWEVAGAVPESLQRLELRAFDVDEVTPERLRLGLTLGW